MWPKPTQDFDFNEFQSTLHKLAFTKVTAFLDIFFKILILNIPMY